LPTKRGWEKERGIGGEKRQSVLEKRYGERRKAKRSYAGKGESIPYHWKIGHPGGIFPKRQPLKGRERGKGSLGRDGRRGKSDSLLL